MADTLIDDRPGPGPDDPGAPGDADAERADGEGSAGQPGRVQRAWDAFVGMPVEGWITLFVVGFCVGFVFVQLGPSKVLANNTPAGGDMGAHVWGPAYLRDHLLPSGRLSGWTPDWYAGFPAYTFYMVIPSLAIALLSYVIPYGIAFKLVAISGVLSLPVAAWAFGRLSRLPFPAPPMLAVAATAFLFDRSFSIYGGNIASTLAGEFAFSISLTFAVLYLGVLARGLETGRYRAWAAVLLALTALCHLIPLFFALAGTVVWVFLQFDWGRVRLWMWALMVAGSFGAGRGGRRHHPAHRSAQLAHLRARRGLLHRPGGRGRRGAGRHRSHRDAQPLALHRARAGRRRSAVVVLGAALLPAPRLHERHGLGEEARLRQLPVPAVAARRPAEQPARHRVPAGPGRARRVAVARVPPPRRAVLAGHGRARRGGLPLHAPGAAVERPAAALLLPVPLPAGSRRPGVVLPGPGPAGGGRRAPAVASDPVGGRPGHVGRVDDRAGPARSTPCPTAATPATGRPGSGGRSARRTPASSPAGPTGTSPATRARRPIPSTTPSPRR